MCIKLTQSDSLLRKSCKCNISSNNIDRTKYNIEPNQQINNLTVIKYDANIKAWHCLCTCGRIRYIRSKDLYNKKITKCKCEESKNLLPNDMGAKRRIYNQYELKAKSRSLIFELTFEQFCDLITQNCFYCGEEHSNKMIRRNRSFSYNGIDRIDNNIGYTKTNSITCCKYCNSSKLDKSIEDFIDHLYSMVEYVEKNKELFEYIKVNKKSPND